MQEYTRTLSFVPTSSTFSPNLSQEIWSAKPTASMRLLCLIRVCLLVDLLLNRAGGEVEGADDLVREADGADELTTTTSSFWNLVSGFCCACPQRFCCGCVAVSWQRFQICSLWITCSTRLSHFNSHLLIIISDAPCQSRVLICPSSKVQLS